MKTMQQLSTDPALLSKCLTMAFKDQGKTLPSDMQVQVTEPVRQRIVVRWMASHCSTCQEDPRDVIQESAHVCKDRPGWCNRTVSCVDAINASLLMRSALCSGLQPLASKLACTLPATIGGPCLNLTSAALPVMLPATSATPDPRMLTTQRPLMMEAGSQATASQSFEHKSFVIWAGGSGTLLISMCCIFWMCRRPYTRARQDGPRFQPNSPPPRGSQPSLRIAGAMSAGDGCGSMNDLRDPVERGSRHESSTRVFDSLLVVSDQHQNIQDELDEGPCMRTNWWDLRTGARGTYDLRNLAGLQRDALGDKSASLGSAILVCAQDTVDAPAAADEPRLVLPAFCSHGVTQIPDTHHHEYIDSLLTTPRSRSSSPQSGHTQSKRAADEELLSKHRRAILPEDFALDDEECTDDAGTGKQCAGDFRRRLQDNFSSE